MSKICESFIEELSSPANSHSRELKAHLAACPECKMMAESLAAFTAARAPLSIAEQASIHKMTTLVQNSLSTVTANDIPSSATQAAKTGITKIIAGLVAVAGILSAGLFFHGHSNKNLPETSTKQPAIESTLPETEVITKKELKTNFEKGQKLSIGKDSEVNFIENSTLKKVSENNIDFASGKISAKYSGMDGTYVLKTPDADFEIMNAKFECSIQNGIVSLKVLSGIVKVQPKNGQKAQELKQGQLWESQIEENVSENSRTLIVNPGEEEINLPDGEN